MRRLTLSLLFVVLVSSASHAGYELTISRSSTNPFLISDSPPTSPPLLRTLYLWTICSPANFQIEGISALQAALTDTSNITVLSFTPATGVLNAGTATNLLLGISNCNSQLFPFLLGEILIYDNVGSICLASSPVPLGVSCETNPSTVPVRCFGFASNGDTPPVIGDANDGCFSNAILGDPALDDGWQAGFGDPTSGGQGTDDKVLALAAYDGALIAGGLFLKAGSASASRIASWNGTSWSSIGNGVSAPANPFVAALLPFNAGADLLVGGSFETAGTIPAKGVAKLTGSSWSAMGSGLKGTVQALAVYQGLPYAAGTFTQDGDSQVVNHIAKWNNPNWDPLTDSTGGVGVNATPNALAVFSGSLIVAGSFSMAGNTTVSNIASWNGSNFSALGPGLNDNVRTLAVYNGSLIAGGDFSNAGSLLVHGIAAWNGTAWQALDNGFATSAVAALCLYDDNPSSPPGQHLFVGGNFNLNKEVTDGVSVYFSRAARWQPSSWSGMGTGIGENIPVAHIVHAIAPFDGKLYWGGLFVLAGGKPSQNIAAWEDNEAVGVGDDNRVGFNTAFLLSKPSPNPTRLSSTITLYVGNGAQVEVSLLDVSGKLVNILYSGYLSGGAHALRILHATPGVYFVRATAPGRVTSQKVVFQ